MSGLNEIKAINAWAASSACKNATAAHNGGEVPNSPAPAGFKKSTLKSGVRVLRLQGRDVEV